VSNQQWPSPYSFGLNLSLKYSNCSYIISCWTIFCYFSLYKVITWMQSIKFIRAFKPFFITSKIHDGFNFNEFFYKSFYFPFTLLFVLKSWWWIRTSVIVTKKERGQDSSPTLRIEFTLS
jgi:hypothetical protein